MAFIPRSVEIEVYKLSMSHEQSTLSKFKELGKNRKKSQPSFTYVVKQGAISIGQWIRWVGIFVPDIIGLILRSSGWKTSI